MIENAMYHYYRVSEVIQFLTYVFKAFERQGEKPAGLPEKLNELQNLYKELQASYSSEQGSKLTTVIQELDSRRDAGEICLSTIIKGYQLHHDENKKEAANILARAVDKFGASIARMNYQSETATLTRLVNDLETVEELRNAVNLLNLNEVVQEIKVANAEFETTYMTRLQQNAKGSDKSAMELKAETNKVYEELIKLLEAHMLIQGEEKFATLTSEINELVETYNKIVEDRRASGETEEETVEESTEPAE